MDAADKDKLPIVADDFVVTVRGGMTHIGFFARLAPHGSKGDEDEERVCVARIASHPDGIRGLRDTLSQIVDILDGEAVKVKTKRVLS